MCQTQVSKAGTSNCTPNTVGCNYLPLAFITDSDIHKSSVPGVGIWCNIHWSILVEVQYIPRNMHTVFALLCFVVVIHWLIFPYPSGLLHWHCGNLTIAPVPAKQPWWIWINTSCEFIMNDCITTTKQSTTKPCAYFLGYTVMVWCQTITQTIVDFSVKLRGIHVEAVAVYIGIISHSCIPETTHLKLNRHFEGPRCVRHIAGYHNPKTWRVTNLL